MRHMRFASCLALIVVTLLTGCQSDRQSAQRAELDLLLDPVIHDRVHPRIGRLRGSGCYPEWRDFTDFLIWRASDTGC